MCGRGSPFVRRLTHPRLMVSIDVRRAADALSAAQGGVFSRAQARALGADRWAVAHEIAAGRWRALGREAVANHQLPLGDRARWWSALFNGGPSCALDGVTSLLAHGLSNFQEESVHLIAPWPNGPESWTGVWVHRSRLWDLDDLVEVDGLRRTRPGVATVRAAMWARSHRAAVTVMAMAVQQGIASAQDVLAEAVRLNRHKRRPMILAVAHDIADGARALSELDFAAMCRRAGLPVPSRQVLRRGPRGRWYLDVYWEEYRLVVEVEGAHHDAPEAVIDDTFRQNELTIGRDAVLRVPVLGLRACPELFIEQLCRALVAFGWRPAA